MAAWLTLQLFVLLYFVWLERVEGRDHHRGMFFGAIMAVLLFPGVEIVMYLLAIPFWAAEALGHPILVQNEMLASVLGLVVWGSSAFITVRFWTWVWMRLSRRAEPGRAA